MREILFRGFHPFKDGEEKIFYNNKWVKGEWVYGNYGYRPAYKIFALAGCGASKFKEATHFIQTYKKTELGIICAEWHDVIPETVGQYTGLEDKNGRKIFEGDILGFLDVDEKLSTMCVEFFNGTFCIIENGIKGDPVYDVMCLDIEVISNIHSNPELLEVE